MPSPQPIPPPMKNPVENPGSGNSRCIGKTDTNMQDELYCTEINGKPEILSTMCISIS